MTTINKLSALDTLSGGDQLAVWATGNGDTRKASMNLVASYVTGTIDLPVDISRSQYAAPSTSGFTVAITLPNTWLVLTPTNPLAAGTIALPGNVPNLSMVSIVTTDTITSFNVTASGAAVIGAPTTLEANQAFTLRYDAVTNAWYPENQSVVNASLFMQTLLNDPNAAAARATLGLGSISTQAANGVAITGGSISGITDLAIADGGTGASNAAGARTNLGAGAVGGNVFVAGTASAAQQAMDVEVGVDVQAYDADTAKTDVAQTFTAQQSLTAGLVLQSVSNSDLGAIGSSINTTNKVAGKVVYATGLLNNRLFVAEGSAAGDRWLQVDGGAAITPV
jgi:hypothetical protein